MVGCAGRISAMGAYLRAFSTRWACALRLLARVGCTWRMCLLGRVVRPCRCLVATVGELSGEHWLGQFSRGFLAPGTARVSTNPQRRIYPFWVLCGGDIRGVGVRGVECQRVGSAG